MDFLNIGLDRLRQSLRDGECLKAKSDGRGNTSRLVDCGEFFCIERIDARGATYITSRTKQAALKAYAG